MRRIVILLMAASAIVGAASKSYAISEYGTIFLLIRPGARASGMGSAFAAVADDASATYFNPAGLAFLTEHEITYMYSQWLPEFAPDLYYMFSSYVHPLGEWGVVGGNVTWLSYGKQVRTNEEGEELGEFYAYDIAPAVSYGMKLSESVGVGANLKYIYSHLADLGTGVEQGKGTGSSYALDLGILYKGPVPYLTLAGVLQNLGPNISYISPEESDPLARNLRLGFAYRLLDDEISRLTVAGEVTKVLVALGDDLGYEFDEAVKHVGAEYIYYDIFALRTGYVYDKIGRIQGPTFGVGFNVKFFMFDFAMEPGGEVQHDNKKFSLGARF
ncbi:hypothetical protein AMJ39_01130 [candidate division TA06 bacterium DG_24]|uniref:Type IX secretion system protein PorV domain-containing protein n=3 Tax=Bacteria division TA06 TaxID=1156500 RepID=A0A0S8JMD3_UNCT6|nr:MAG: hypothetical protein AMJ39_01130 [candidate division TA06 bacterium DG_24]KPK71649.1 MAG: hypothetical protein AMJ82_00035 [candidate division TA06 bacterium SM23_40]KPL09867.1 MAG: hypothetical protein AMJ71_05330 [candidate division TA06 bacterium SM1_40]